MQNEKEVPLFGAGTDALAIKFWFAKAVPCPNAITEVIIKS